MNYLRRSCTWNIQISPLTKITKLMPASYLFPFISQHAENETKSRKRWFWLACEHRRILVGYLKLLRYSGLWALWWCKKNANWTTLSYFSNCSIFSAKKLETTSTTKKWQQNLKNCKVRFRQNIDVRKEMEDSRLNAIECLKTDYVRKRSTEF